jgi:hypothetical protein
MKIYISDSLRKCGLIAILFAVVSSCQEDDNAPPSLTAEEIRQQSAIAAEETNEMAAIAQEALEISSEVMESEGITSGRATESVNSKKGYFNHHGCDPDVTTNYDVDFSHRDTVIYRGSISVDYGDGSTCDPKHVRKGKITSAFRYIYTFGENRSWSALEVITFKDYVRDSTITNGEIRVTSHEGVKAVQFKLAMTDYRDGLMRRSNAHLKFFYHSNNTFKWKDNTITLFGQGSGITRHGHTYEFFIKEELLYKYACFKHHNFYPVQGKVTGVIDGTNFWILYGNGECDNLYTLTINGETTTHEFGKKDD